jgi:hypothetical protein
MLSLPEFLLRWNERPLCWGFVRPWVPRRAARYSWIRVLTVTAAGGGLAALVSWGGFWLALSGVASAEASELLASMQGWMTGAAAEFGALAGLSWSLLSRRCWNHRAQRLAASPEIFQPTLQAQLPFWKGSIPAVIYAALVFGATPLLLFHAIENARGALVWRQTRATLKARGECLELACIIPPPVRDEENFFATPFWSHFHYTRTTDASGRNSTIQWADTNWSEVTRELSLPNVPTPKNRLGVPPEKTPEGRTDLAAWATAFRTSTSNALHRPARGSYGSGDQWVAYPIPETPGNPAADVLQALTKLDPVLAEFEAASDRPHNRYPYHYEDGFSTLLMPLSAMKSATRSVALRSAAQLTQGQTAEAAADVVLAFRLGDSLREDPYLISQLVRYACDAIALHAMWEGLIDHRWSDEQLARFQDVLTRRDYAPGSIRAIECERNIAGYELERILADRLGRLHQLEALGGNNSPSEVEELLTAISILMPDGWFRQNQAQLMQGYQNLLDSARTAMKPAARTEALKEAQALDEVADRFLIEASAHTTPRNFLVRRLLPSLGKASQRAQRAITLARLGAVACALERHQRAHGRYPESLLDLGPATLKALPDDWMSGQPFRYRRTEDGRFELWSVGPDGKDDGGIYRTRNRKNNSISEDRDWPWPSATPNTERMF